MSVDGTKLRSNRQFYSAVAAAPSNRGYTWVVSPVLHRLVGAGRKPPPTMWCSSVVKSRRKAPRAALDVPHRSDCSATFRLFWTSVRWNVEGLSTQQDPIGGIGQDGGTGKDCTLPREPGGSLDELQDGLISIWHVDWARLRNSTRAARARSLLIPTAGGRELGCSP